jgi:hypothetical protein
MSREKNPRTKALMRTVWAAPALGISALAGLLILFLTVYPSHAQIAGSPTATNSLASLLQMAQAVFNSIPAPPDAPLLDSSGNVVLDASGNSVSDPNEGFHAVMPQDFDPGHTNLVEAGWLDGLGCPTGASVAISNATGTGIDHFEGFTDAACLMGDPKDKKNEGLLLVKTGPTNNFAAATAELKKVRGITLNELGYDIRKSGGTVASPLGSHCGGGAPRFNISTNMGFFFLGCNSVPPAMVANMSNAWLRLRWGPAELALLGIPPNAVVQRISILFDEGTDTGADFFGAAIIDNVDVNGTLVGHGPDED